MHGASSHKVSNANRQVFFACLNSQKQEGVVIVQTTEKDEPVQKWVSERLRRRQSRQRIRKSKKLMRQDACQSQRGGK